MSRELHEHSACDEQPFDLETATLEPPELGANVWGGDGTDLHRPVRAHVLAALAPNSAPYAPPVDRLLRLGDAHDTKLARRRSRLGIGQAHVADLVRIARSRALNTVDSDAAEVWAPVHAIELLTELNTATVLEDIVPLLDYSSDWFDSVLPTILASAAAARSSRCGAIYSIRAVGPTAARTPPML